MEDGMEETRKKIMMVDDDPTILKMGRIMLKDAYDVFPIPSAAKLFGILEKITPDLILLDICMPETDGPETLKRLKADERYAKIPVIFVTALDDDKHLSEQISLGACGSIPKPFSAPELLKRVGDCLS
jgi:putative two-component system response regulator